MRNLAVGLAVFTALTLSGCASSLDVASPITDTSSFISTEEQVLQPGNAVRVVVFGHESLSGTYALDKAGAIRLGSLGNVPAGGLTPAELEQKIAEMLKARGVNDAQVSVMIN